MQIPRLPSKPLIACIAMWCAIGPWSLLSAEQNSTQDETIDEQAPKVVRLLSPPGRVAEGETDIEALLIDPEIRELVFYVDGREADRRKKLPWRGRVELDSPPRRQTITVRAFGPGDRLMGEDSVEINRVYRPFRVRLNRLEGEVGDHVLVGGEVSLPYGAELERVDLFVGETPMATIREATFEGRLSHPIQKGDLVKAIAQLKDGRTIEDVLVFGVQNVERGETFLVQLQVLVNRKDGPPIRGMKKEEFKLIEKGVERPVDSLQPADDVALTLGLVVDSSESMDRLWYATRGAVQSFLGSLMGPKDRAFLTTFSDQVQLAAGWTDDPMDIDRAMEDVKPEGITALYDSIVFSMLQFGNEPGRRALVVLTDGMDYGSHSDPDQVVKFGEQLGIPVYVVAMVQRDISRGRASFQNESTSHSLKLLTDPTGGRLLRTGARGGLDRAFQQISDELRSQYLLTYYTDRSIDDLTSRDVEIQVPGRKKVEVRAVLAWDQVR